MSKISVGPERLHRLILAPIISEKGTRALESGNHVLFRVLLDAEKSEIKIAVEKLFSVKVLSVSTLRVKGKAKGKGGTIPAPRFLQASRLVACRSSCALQVQL